LIVSNGIIPSNRAQHPHHKATTVNKQTTIQIKMKMMMHDIITRMLMRRGG